MPDVILPWVEHNGALIGVVVALVPIVSTWRASKRRLRKYVGVILELVDQLITRGKAVVAEAEASAGGSYIKPAIDWSALRTTTLPALKDVSATAPHDAKLAFAVQDLIRTLSSSTYQPSTLNSAASALAYLQPLLREISEKRAAIARRRWKLWLPW